MKQNAFPPVLPSEPALKLIGTFSKLAALIATITVPTTGIKNFCSSKAAVEKAKNSAPRKATPTAAAAAQLTAERAEDLLSLKPLVT